VAQSLSSAAEHSSLSNSAARAELIRKAVRELAEKEREVQALNAEIREYKVRVVKGHLGFKLSDWAAVYRVTQLTVSDRDALLECLHEGFQALAIGSVLDWVSVLETAQRRRASTNGTAPADDAARAWGRSDGLGGVHDHADDYPPGEPGHGDYALGLADGEAERDRVMALGESGNGHANGDAGEAAPRRGRGRPRKRRQEAGAEA
jgi:Arc/MetJ-type ribon-helix-helix transcriptional regulator